MYYLCFLLIIPVVLAIAGGWYMSDRLRESGLRLYSFPPDDMTRKIVNTWRLSGTLPEGTRIREVRVPAPLGGVLPAWYLPGEGTTWLVSLHGKNGLHHYNVNEYPRMAAARGVPSMAISYRGDPGTTPDPSGFHQYGRTERDDLEAALLWATARGAERFILAANSYGGGIAAAFLRDGNPYLASMVTAVIFDAPMLSFRECVRHVSRSLPGGRFMFPLVCIAEKLATLRFGVNWKSVDYLADVSWLKVPALVFHGDKDAVVPVTGSIRLQENAPCVVLERSPAAGHGEMTLMHKPCMRLAAMFIAAHKNKEGMLSETTHAAH
jgi:uncharacterized protein